ncbi:RHS repeat domain-containing protein, partial [Halopseudomonas sabulinigri]|uniref:RHS repeat domain-containing protein n=1 Tax=Halopseudomonas sabulinigri TaxID=472181 RepID=UPI003341535A
AYINGNTLYARVTNKNPSGAGTVTTNHALGAVNNNTNYTLEIEAHDSGTRLYFYPKGGARSAGYSYTSQLPQLGDMRFIAYGRSSSTSSSSLTYLDNLKVATGGIAIGIDAPQERYMHTDHLGSVVAVTDNQGRILERFSYDAWGKRRNLDGTDDSAYDLQGQGLLPALSTHHGFTGHEMLDEMSLVHMNGRLYDPLIARFVSADPNIDGLYTTQGLNSYTYVHNNPLNKTDPSGYFSLSKVFKGIKKALSKIHSVHKKIHNATRVPGQTVIRAVGPQAASAIVAVASYFCGPFYVACVAVGNADIAQAHGASTTQALRAGAIAGALAYASQGASGAIGGMASGVAGGSAAAQFAATVAFSGIYQGVISAATGGDFRSGFLSGSFGAFAQGMGLNDIPGEYGVVVSGVVGGTGSVLGGGKFAEGAIITMVRTIKKRWGEIAQERSATAVAESSERPELEAIAKNQTINAAIDSAWEASNPNTPGSKIENGFWIIRDNLTKALSVQMFPMAGASRDRMSPGLPPILKGRTVIAFFHTHPNTVAEGYINGPSDPDMRFSNHPSINLPGMIRSHAGMHYFGPALPE